MGILSMYVHVPCGAWCPQRPEKDARSPDTAVTVVVSCHVDTGNKTWVL